ncbi:MAG: HlyD family secretion protein [Burkholderiaceae bacterium]|jgi:membrane fusion protein (multidrug efflux system)
MVDASEAGPRSYWRSRSVFLVAGLLGFVLAIVAYIGIVQYYRTYTDDAYVEAHIVSVTSKIPAYVAALHFDDNSVVRRGDLLIELDPRDFEVQRSITRANLAAAQGLLTESLRRLSVAELNVKQADAELGVIKANAALALANLGRVRAVADSRAVSIERVDEAVANDASSRAAVSASEVKVATAKAQVELARAQNATALASVSQAEAQVSQSDLNLSYARIYAAEDGSVAQRLVEPGNYVQPGQTLVSIVPIGMFVTANYKETQLRDVRAGQPVVVTVDAYPSIHLKGHVESLQRGTGSRFALLPPENATGNFVKVVQRVPVKVTLDNLGEAAKWLSPGMSVETKIDTSGAQ